jgi:hypothetical protein
MLVGVTHDKSGQTLIRRSVTTKVAIGRGPDGNRKYPEKLDHFIFLRKEQGGDSVEWVEDEAMTKHYKGLAGGEDPTEVTIVLLDDSPDNVFRTEFAWWAKTGKKCHGDGESAQRREGDDWQPRQTCANSGKCKEFEAGDCKPSADLYFMLADFPSLGTACRLHTSSYQSIREVYSALNDLRNMMGGRLLGLPVKLFVRPEKNVYGEGENKKTGTKYVLGLELRGDSLPKMLENVTESAKVFADLRKAMSRVEIIEDDDERAPEIAAEFVSADRLLPAAVPAAVIPPAPPPDPLLAEFEALCTKLNLNKANRHFLLTRHNGELDKALAELRFMDAGDLPAEPQTGSKKKKKPAATGTVTGLTNDLKPTAEEPRKYGF